jgi:hypothetical protein
MSITLPKIAWVAWRSLARVFVHQAALEGFCTAAVAAVRVFTVLLLLQFVALTGAWSAEREMVR